MEWRPSATARTLHARASLLRVARTFFDEHGLLEVEVPLLQSGANLDRGIEPLAVDHEGERRYLITSPEHPLKRLLAAGYGDVWTCAQCVRCGERGSHHAPVFTMLEWYRLGLNERHLAVETLELLGRLTGLAGGVQILTYREAFRRHLGLDPATAEDEELAASLDPTDRAAANDRRELLDLLLSLKVQTRFSPQAWTVITDWPVDQSAQARISGTGDNRSAARFEIYRGSLELANGYHECTDADELRSRLAAEQQASERSHAPKRDQRFEDAMAHGLPDCAGVALGFDRVMMLALGIDDISEVQAFGWDNA